MQFEEEKKKKKEALWQNQINCRKLVCSFSCLNFISDCNEGNIVEKSIKHSFRGRYSLSEPCSTVTVQKPVPVKQG